MQLPGPAKCLKEFGFDSDSEAGAAFRMKKSYRVELNASPLLGSSSSSSSSSSTLPVMMIL